MFTVKFNRNQSIAVVCLVLIVVTAALYWPMLHHDFINFDDDEYITDNAHVTAGLTWPGVAWAFRSGDSANWHPLTWISHMLDCQLYGLRPGGHHATNLIFHIANTLLLFFWLNQLTGAVWRSGFVAALFAWHPMHVESVAWASERKDVLSAFFGLLTLIAYTSYARRVAGDKWQVARPNSTLSRVTRHVSPYYWLALFFFACGLMSKPMVVTLPFVLLLLDFWPLGRWSRVEGRESRETATLNPRLSAPGRLVLEKLPFFVLAAAASVVTYFVQTAGRTLWSAAALPLSSRIANVLWAYERYISKLFWPADLVIVYPYPLHWPAGVVVGAAIFLVLWSALFIWRLRQNPYLFVGWFWFLGMLVPVIGLVQVGSQSMADRYTYLPAIGLFILVAWTLYDWIQAHPARQPLVVAMAIAALTGCLAVTRVQLGYWQNSLTLFEHAVKTTPDNFVALTCLGETLEKLNLQTNALMFCSEAVNLQPNSPVAQYNLGMCLLQNGRPDDALAHLQAAAQLSPRNPDIQYNLGVFLLLHGRPAEAADCFAAALRERPDFAGAQNRLAQALLQQHRPKDAAAHFREALRLKPDFVDALNRLAWLLATDPDPEIRSGPEAVRLAKRACELTQNRQAAQLTTLAAACAEAGQFADAIAAVQQARDLALAAGQTNIVDQDRALLEQFQAKNPHREAP